jgi:acyl dehydratase
MVEPLFDQLPPRDERWYESYCAGSHYQLGSFCVTTNEIIAFATNYDPQPFHLEIDTPGGIIASGWHSICLAMRLIADNYLSSVAALPSPGVSEIRWTKPVYPDHKIELFATLTSARVSVTKGDRGILSTRFWANDPDEHAVLSFEAVSFVQLQNPT